MTRFLKSKYLGLLVMAAGAAAAFVIYSPAKSASSTNLGTVTRADLIQRVTIAGGVNPFRKSIISAPYNGYVRKLHVQIGDRVQAGSPVVSLAQTLHGSTEEVHPLRAPFNGTVVQVLRSEGEYVDQQNSQGNGTALLRIDDLSRMYVEANAPEIEVGKLKIGQEAVIKASAILTRSYKGRIKHIALAAKEQKDWDKSRVEFPIQIEVNDSDGQLMPGMSVVVDITTNKREKVLSLRHEFIQKDGDQYFAVTEKGEKKPIGVGLQNEEAFEIKNGLSEGERVRQTDFLSLSKER